MDAPPCYRPPLRAVPLPPKKRLLVLVDAYCPLGECEWPRAGVEAPAELELAVARQQLETRPRKPLPQLPERGV